MPRTRMNRSEPKGWKERRTRNAWGLFFLAAVLSLFLQWLAQIVGGAIVGGIAGVEGLAKITTADYDALNQATWWSSGIITVIVVAKVVSRAWSDLTWSIHGYGMEWGIDWWDSFWRPVLIGTAIHGVIFSGIMMVAASA